MASVQVPPAVQHPGSAIPSNMTQQQAQELYLVRIAFFFLFFSFCFPPALFPPLARNPLTVCHGC